MLNRYHKTCFQQINRHLHLNANRLSQNCLPDCLSNLTTAISKKGCWKKYMRQSRKVLWVIFSSLFFKDICKNGTRVHGLMFAIVKGKQQKISTVSGTVYWSYPTLPFGIVAYTFFLTTFLEIAVYRSLIQWKWSQLFGKTFTINNIFAMCRP